MSLIKFKKREDFGHEYYVQILNIKRTSLLQASVSWNDEPSWPYIQIQSGSGTVLGIMFWVHKFGFDIDFISRTWRWDHMKEIDEEEDVQHTD